jgi:hypothetical protein
MEAIDLRNGERGLWECRSILSATDCAMIKAGPQLGLKGSSGCGSKGARDAIRGWFEDVLEVPLSKYIRIIVSGTGKTSAIALSSSRCALYSCSKP